MHSITICIPTYKRPLLLKKLVLSILECNIDKSLIKDITIIIVDNDIGRTAEKIIEELKEKQKSSYKLNYHNYPVKGLSNVRNELFKKALELNPDYIVSIDDDEYATNEWLNQLLLSITYTRGDIVVGNVIPEFENKVSPYISYWFKYHNYINHQSIKFVWTGNFIISSNFLIKNEIEFDNRFNTTGGEDFYFGVTALNRGAKIYWASKAIAYETISDKRARLKWLIMRSYNGAITFVYVLKIEKKYLGLLKKIFVSIVYFFGGGIALLIVPFPIKWRYWGILKISESIGGFAGLINVKYHEYNKER